MPTAPIARPGRAAARTLARAFGPLAALAALTLVAVTFLLPAPSVGRDNAALTTPVAARHAAMTTKHVRYVGYGQMQATINRCHGPGVANTAQWGGPWLMVEHNYCGGSWLLSACKGQLLKITSGPLAGTWRANGKTRVIRQGASLTTTRGLGALVGQTCYFHSNKIRLVGFTRLR